VANGQCPLDANLLRGLVPWVALAVVLAGVSVTGVVLELGFGVRPCPMCWWQRWAHYALLAVALLGWALPAWRRWLVLVGLPVALAGLGVALWQVAAQQGWLPWPPSCTAAELVPLAAAGDLLGALQTTRIIPCDQEDFTLLGLSLAAWNVPMMVGVLGLLGVGGKRW